jgi:hypothetical protein
MDILVSDYYWPTLYCLTMDRIKNIDYRKNTGSINKKERVMGLEPTNGSLGSYCLTTWQHPLFAAHYSQPVKGCQGKLLIMKGESINRVLS